MNTLISPLTLGWRNFWRDLRAGELRMLLVAMVLAVTALTAVAFFSERLSSGLRRDAAQLLGGDVVVSSDQPTPVALLDKARALGLTATQTQSLMTMSRTTPEQGGAAALVTIKAVAAHYPLRGVLGTSSNPHWQANDGFESRLQGPAAGEVWPEPALLRALNVQLGDTLLLGDLPLRITQVLVHEPDRGNSLMSLTPRLLLNGADLPATGLIQPASRVNYRLALVGAPASVAAFVQWTQAHIQHEKLRGIRLETLEEGNPQMQQTLQRATGFLHLVALLAALLAAVTVALAAHSLAQRHLDDCAMLRVLGLSQRTIALSYALEFVLLGWVGSALGLLGGFVTHYAFLALLGQLAPIDLPLPGWLPIAMGLGMGLTLLLAFGLPPVLQLAGAPPIRVIRRDMGRPHTTPVLALLLGTGGFAALLLAASRDWLMGAIATAGFGVAVLLFVVLSYALVGCLRGLLQRMQHSLYRVGGWALALQQITTRPAHTVVQTSSLALGLLALVVLVLLRTELIAHWHSTSAAHAPNRFVINILPDQADAFTQLLHEAGIGQFDWYPMIRGRLLSVNGQPIVPEQFSSERARRLADREFGLSHAAQPPAYNQIVAGHWRSEEADGISMEAGIMQTLGLKLGDVLLFDMGGVQRSARITSVRKVNWSSMHVNFFAMFPVSQLGDDVATTYITAYRAPDEAPNAMPDGALPLSASQAPRHAASETPAAQLERRMLAQFPNITHIDTTQGIAQVQRVVGQVIRAMELLFGFGLAAGAVVVWATLGTTRQQRAHELAVMRVLGGSARTLQRLQSTELLLTGALAGGMAAAVGLLLTWLLARYAFDLDWMPVWLTLPIGAAIGAVVAQLAGWLALRGLLQQPVAHTLRQAVVE